MTTATLKTNAAWKAKVVWVRRFYTTVEPVPPPEVDEAAVGAIVKPTPRRLVEIPHSVIRCVVRVSRAGCRRIEFVANHRDGRDITFTDPRGRGLGTAGVTGIWGTRPAPPVYRPRPLLPTEFQLELARLVGAERAARIVNKILEPDFFGADAQGMEPGVPATERPHVF